MSELENYLMEKAAEVSGTHPMPNGAKLPTSPDLNPARTIRKVATDSETAGSLPKNEGQPGEQVQKLPQATPFKLDVLSKDDGTTAPAQSKQAHRYALPAFGRYPLDDYAQVKQAAEYFGEWGGRMAPSLRREYCVNLVKRANELGIKVGDEVRHYGALDYGPHSHVEACLELRRGAIKQAEFQRGLDYLKDSREGMRPDDFAVALGEFDKVAGIEGYYGKDVPDPYWTTFGEKRADDEGALLVGNDYISQEELKRFARVHSCQLKDVFGDDFCDEFRKDPVGITKSLPTDQKKMVIRMASSALTDPTTT